MTTIANDDTTLTDAPAPVTICAVKKTTNATVGRPRSEVLTPFGQWLDAHSMSRDAAAKELAVTRGQIDKLARGGAIPSVLVMWDIHVLTGGKVSLKEWVLVALKRPKPSAGPSRKRRKS